MTEADEPQFNTLAERIAALNSQRNFTAPPASKARRPPPPPPPPPPPVNRQLTAPASDESNHLSHERSPTMPRGPPQLPRRTTTTTTTTVNSKENGLSPVLPRRDLAPPLPVRRDSEQTSPALPARRQSTQSLAVRRNSNASDISHISTISTLSLNNSAGSTDGYTGRKLPPALDSAVLPPLPPTKRELEAREKEEVRVAKETKPPPLLPARSAPVVPRAGSSSTPDMPPRLPSRPARPPEESAPSLPRRLPPPSTKFVRTIPEVSGNTAGGTPSNAAPPPVPMASRPSLAQIDEVSTRAAAPNSCLVCRDFSGPDSVAARYPRQSIPPQDPVGYLAQVLCGPFPSLTDKSRAIFTWCHHNIAYNVDGFFSGRLSSSTARDTILNGLAVCEGYARVYEAVAKRAGLECVVVGGHGKGYGYTPVGKNQAPPPRNPTGHAWNAVRIDNGEWKLTDPCWGAGNVKDDQTYQKAFKPDEFTKSNEMFGLKHFPSDSRHFFLPGGRIPTWEEYIIGPVHGERAKFYSNAIMEGISEPKSSPLDKYISVSSGQTVRFQLAKLCEHWTSEKNGLGKRLLLLMKIHGIQGVDGDLVPLEHDGYWWWIDIPARELGKPGQTISLYGVDTINGQSARGLTKSQFLSKKGNCGMSFVGIAAWELV